MKPSFLKHIQPVQLTRQEELFLFSGLMLITCFFLPWHGLDASPWVMASDPEAGYGLLGWIVLLLLIGLVPLATTRPRIRPWIAILTAFSINTALASAGSLSGNTSYGAVLTQFFALTMLVLSARPAVVKATDLAMKRLNSQKAEVFTHWGTTLSGLQFSAQDFYTRLEQEIRARNWPGVEFLRVQHTEAGLLSHKREYLRVVRQRQVFDVCAGSFGNDYFFTLREAELKAQLSLVTVLIFLLALYLIFTWNIGNLGLTGAAINSGVMLVIGVLLLWNVLRMGLTRFDGLLMRTPVIGPIYETWFRTGTTYFQHDTRMVFLKLMDDLVKAGVDEETSAKGVQLLSCFEHQPILDGLYKTSAHPLKGDK